MLAKSFNYLISFVYYLFIEVYSQMQKEIDKPYQKHHSLKEKKEGLLYCREIKSFLEEFKTKKCLINYQHDENLLDKRRNPYYNHTFLYNLNNSCSCDRDKCQNYHNFYQRIFHPLAFKQQKCANYYECPFKIQCYNFHAQDEKHFELGEYFRFDINTFKTKPCPRKDPHERKICLYYHNDKDKRRQNFEAYTQIICNIKNCNNPNCQRAHNKIEQLYHPIRYKSKFCTTYEGDFYTCEYRDFCSFAHTKEELTITLIDQTNNDPNYKVYNYKTVWCPYTLDHDRGNCPYAHNYQDFRRNPKDYKYMSDKCESWDFVNKIESIEEGKCKLNMNCNKCHGWMQQRYHPQIYLAQSKKGKNYINKEEAAMIEKKLLKKPQKPKPHQQKEKNIEVIAYKQIEATKTVKYAVGAPFFKSDRQNSQTSKKTKAKTGNVGSDKSCNEDEKQVRHKNVFQPQQQKNLINKISLYGQNWQFNNEALESKTQTRSKSQGNSSDFAPSYSHTIKDIFVNEKSLIDKLGRMKIHEVSLINADEKKINNMSFLNPKEKLKLVNKLKEYSLKKDIRFIQYSKSLTHFFVKNKADQILQKLRDKKVNEAQILKLQSRQSTKDFSFLTEQQKELLPRLLKKYHEEMQFGSIMSSVEKFIEQPPHDHDFNNDN